MCLRLHEAREGHSGGMTTAQQVRPHRRTSRFPEESPRVAVAIGAVLVAASATWVGLGGMILQRFL